MRIVQQHIANWDGWPADVREKLRQWNRDYLLSFSHHGDFFCEGCAREIKGHPSGNAILRPWTKAHSTPRCEDCVVSIARVFAVPPETLAPRARDVVVRLLRRIRQLENRNGRLRIQLELDQIYMDRLEDEVAPDVLEAVRDELRGKHRLQRSPGGNA